MTYQHGTPDGVAIRYSAQAAEAIGRPHRTPAALSEVRDAPPPSDVDRIDPDAALGNRADRRAHAHFMKRAQP